VLIAVAAAIIVGVVVMKSTRGDAATPTAGSNELTVAAFRVGRRDLYREVNIPAEFRPYTEVELHAKVSGYLDKINVDFGDKVKAGQLLATLEVPELQDQLHSAIASQAKAEADYTNAHLNLTRLTAVNQQHPNLVAQQDLDTAQAKDGSAAAAVAAAKADAERYGTLVKYTKITAPFDGVITYRYADPGALIQAGTASDTQSLPVVKLSDNYKLRLDFDVSVDDVKDIHTGDPVEVRVDSLGGRMVSGAITRFTQKVNNDTRTMTTEIEVPNPQLELVPGMYARVILKLQRRPGALAIPIEAVASKNPPTVEIVDAAQQIEERPVKLGLETPGYYEVLDGLKEGDLVVIGSRAAAGTGRKVLAKINEDIAAQ